MKRLKYGMRTWAFAGFVLGAMLPGLVVANATTASVTPLPVIAYVKPA